MADLYFYGASDDCRELDSSNPAWRFEAYGDIALTVAVTEAGITTKTVVVARYAYDGDWAVWLEGDVPADWAVHAIEGNMAQDAYVREGLGQRRRERCGSALHVRVPDTTSMTVRSLEPGAAEEGR